MSSIVVSTCSEPLSESGYSSTIEKNRYDNYTPAPRDYVPQSRPVPVLLQEDAKCEEKYATVADDDDEVKVFFNQKVHVIETLEECQFPSILEKNIKAAKFVKLRKLQSVLFPFAFDGFDIKCQAETGGGKTTAFVLPILDRIIREKVEFGAVSQCTTPFALIIVPTRELAQQVFEQTKKFAYCSNVSVAKAYGHYDVGKNIDEIHRNCDILIATSGRLLHLFESGELNLSQLKIVVLDEVDTLLGENFKEDMVKLLSHKEFQTKGRYQMMLFTATFNKRIELFCNALIRPADSVFISNIKKVPNKRVAQDFVVTTEEIRLQTLIKVLHDKTRKGTLPRTLIFVNFRSDSDILAEKLNEVGIPAAPLNSNHTQDKREEALNEFRQRESFVLVATDVCSRGLNIMEIELVINYQLPNYGCSDIRFASYIYRIGRVGRISPGQSLSLVLRGEELLEKIGMEMEAVGEEIPPSLIAACWRGC